LQQTEKKFDLSEEFLNGSKKIHLYSITKKNPNPGKIKQIKRTKFYYPTFNCKTIFSQTPSGTQNFSGESMDQRSLPKKSEVERLLSIIKHSENYKKLEKKPSDKKKKSQIKNILKGESLQL